MKKKKETILTNEEKKSYEKQKKCQMSKKKTVENFNYTIKLEIIAIIQENIERQLIIFVI